MARLVEVELAILQDLEALGVGLHEAVLDAVVDHLDEVPRADRAAVQPAVRRSERVEHRRQPLDGRLRAADHQAVADVVAPDAARGAGVDELDLPLGQRGRAAAGRRGSSSCRRRPRCRPARGAAARSSIVSSVVMSPAGTMRPHHARALLEHLPTSSRVRPRACRRARRAGRAALAAGVAEHGWPSSSRRWVMPAAHAPQPDERRSPLVHCPGTVHCYAVTLAIAARFSSMVSTSESNDFANEATPSSTSWPRRCRRCRRRAP